MVIVRPPSFTGGVKVTTTSPFPLVAVPIIGASDTVTGVIELLEAEAEPIPTAFVAVTVNVYATPFVKPVMVIGELPPVAV